LSRSLPGGKVCSGLSFGSFGELLQGTLPDGHGEFLVTVPIECRAVAQFFPSCEHGVIEVFPRWKTKSLELARRLLQRHSNRVGGRLYLRSEIPCGKGLSSSSADLVASARAIEAHLGVELPLDELCRSLSEVEPTDGVMFSDSVSYFHVKGALLERLGSLGHVEILSLDEGGYVDTLECHRRGAYQYTLAQQREFRSLLDQLRLGFARNALDEIGAVATRSAQINQAFNPKRHLELMLGACRDTGGAGLITTHSGTCLGILYDTTRPDHAASRARATEKIRPYGCVDVYTVVKPVVEPASTLDWSRFDGA
jgi:uncharacterized protein involved in propanediol utilization